MKVVETNLGSRCENEPRGIIFWFKPPSCPEFQGPQHPHTPPPARISSMPSVGGGGGGGFFLE